LNFLKDRQDPVALADDEYPSWLWTILDRQEKKAEAGAGDLFCTSSLGSAYPYLYYAEGPTLLTSVQRNQRNNVV
jgi:hypothetical protein